MRHQILEGNQSTTVKNRRLAKLVVVREAILWMKEFIMV